jgi:hypothetical protein
LELARFTHHPLCCPTGKTPQRWVDGPVQKYSYLQKFGFAVQAWTSRPPQGAFRDRHEARAGMRWPRRRRRVMVLQGGETREQLQARYDTALTASSNGLDGERTPAVEDPAMTCADGEVVWS